MSRASKVRLVGTAVFALLLLVAGFRALPLEPRGVGTTIPMTVLISDATPCAFVERFEAFGTGWYGGEARDLPVRGPVTGRLHRDSAKEATFTAPGLRPVVVFQIDPKKLIQLGCHVT